jgi:hypothetical protein
MKEMTGEIIFIEYKGKKYEIVFNMNVLETLQKKYGSFNNWTNLIQPNGGEECDIEALKYVFCEAINEGIDIANEDREEKEEPLTMKQVGRIITEIGLKEANQKINQAVIESAKNESKNA